LVHWMVHPLKLWAIAKMTDNWDSIRQIAAAFDVTPASPLYSYTDKQLTSSALSSS